MGGGEAPVVQELRYLGSMLSKNFDRDDSVTIMASIRLARIAFTKLQKAIFGTRRVALESQAKKIAYESLVLSASRCFQLKGFVWLGMPPGCSKC